MTDAIAIIRALRGNERTGMCKCPAHDDDTPSLHVSNGRNGVLVYCHAGCRQDEVLAALKARGVWGAEPQSATIAADLVQDDEPKRIAEARRIAEATAIVKVASAGWYFLRGRIVWRKPERPRAYLGSRGIDTVPDNAWLLPAELTGRLVYDGYALSGRPAMVLPIWGDNGLQGAHVTFLCDDGRDKADVDTAKKSYGRSKGGYVALSNLPETLETLLIGEGAETVLSAMQLSGLPGIAALSKNNLAAITPPAARKYVIAADNDEAGREAAYALRDRLEYQGLIATIAMPPRGDWNDVLLEGEPGAREAWQEALSASPPATRTGAAVAVDEGEFMALTFPQRELFLQPWLPHPGLAMIHAPRGEAKTWLALSVGKAIAAKQDLLGWLCRKYGCVLYVDGELPGAMLQERIDKYERSPPGMFHVLSRDTFQLRRQQMPDLNDAEGRRQLDAIIAEVRADVIILDSISTLVRGGVENDATDWAPIQQWLLQQRWMGRTVILVAHEGRTLGHARGTSKREDVMDTVIGLHKLDDDSTAEEAAFELTFRKARDFSGEAAAPMLLRLSFKDGRINWRTDRIRNVQRERVREMLDSGMKQKEIAKEMGVSPGRVSQLVRDLNNTAKRTDNVIPFKPQRDKDADV